MRKAIVRVVVAMMLPELVKGLIEYVRNILAKVTNNPNFPNPEPTPVQIQAALDGLIQAETLSNTTKGGKGLRDERKAALHGLMKDLAGYVERVANVNPEQAVAIIESAGFHAKRIPLREKLDFEVRQGRVSGEVLLIAKAVARRASYEFQYSTDQKTWTDAAHTLKVKAYISGLAPLTTCFFRFRAVTKAGVTDWSHAVEFIVR